MPEVGVQVFVCPFCYTVFEDLPYSAKVYEIGRITPDENTRVYGVDSDGDIEVWCEQCGEELDYLPVVRIRIPDSETTEYISYPFGTQYELTRLVDALKKEGIIPEGYVVVQIDEKDGSKVWYNNRPKLW